MDAHILLSPVGQKTETRFNCFLTENRKSTEMVGDSFHRLRLLLPPLRRGTRSARPRGLGGDFEFLPLKSPRNPITPFETSRVSTLHPGLYTRFREDANPPDLPPRGRGTARRRWKEFVTHSVEVLSPHQIPIICPTCAACIGHMIFFVSEELEWAGRTGRAAGFRHE